MNAENRDPQQQTVDPPGLATCWTARKWGPTVALADWLAFGRPRRSLGGASAPLVSEYVFSGTAGQCAGQLGYKFTAYGTGLQAHKPASQAKAQSQAGPGPIEAAQHICRPADTYLGTGQVASTPIVLQLVQKQRRASPPHTTPSPLPLDSTTWIPRPKHCWPARHVLGPYINRLASSARPARPAFSPLALQEISQLQQ